MMHLRVRAIVVSASIAGVTAIGLAKPAFMDRYNADPYSKAELHGKCTVCHEGRGGGERNDFGDAFEDGGYRITPKLRAKFPELFEKKLRSEKPPNPEPPVRDKDK
jgi:hypothetical protein